MSGKRYAKRNTSKLKQIAISVAALLMVLLMAVGVTYSWIEGGNTYTMKTGDDTLKVDNKPIAKHASAVLFDPSSGGNLNIGKFDFNAAAHEDISAFKYQDLVLSPVSSADGESFYFPVKDSDGDVSSYREATTNDIGTKFISFEFPYKNCAKKTYLADNGTTITAKKGTTNVDVSPFRISVTRGTDTVIATAGTSAQSNLVVTSIDEQSGAPTFSANALTFNSCSSYKYNPQTKANKFFVLKPNEEGTIRVSVWLDSGASQEQLDALKGCELSISVFFKIDYENITATFKSLTYDTSNNKLTAGNTGGSIKYNGTMYISGSFEAKGTKFEVEAVPNTGYGFVGWYEDEACTKLITKDKTMTQEPLDDTTYYAKFQQLSKTVIYFEDRGYSNYYVYAYGESGDYTEAWDADTSGTKMSIDSVTGYYKYEFETTDVGQFHVFVNNGPGDSAKRWPDNTSNGLAGTIGKTYMFTNSPAGEGSLVEINPANFLKVNVTVFGSGTAVANGPSSRDGAAIYTRSGDTVKFTATPTSETYFVGWYKNNTGTGTAVSSSESYSATVTGAAGATVNYSARFANKITISAAASPAAGGTATVNGASSVMIKPGTKVSLVAETNLGYKFLGWFADSSTIAASTELTFEPSPATETTYTAKFEKLPTSVTTIYVEPRGYSTHALYVYNGSSEYLNPWPGTANTVIDSATGYYKFAFETEDVGTFNAIINNNDGGIQYPTSGNSGLSGTIGKTYLFTNSPAGVGSLVEFDPASLKTVSVSASAGGTATANGNSASAKVISGNTVELKATANTNYIFVGWYSSSTSTVRLSNSTTYTPKITSDSTFHAKFAAKINVSATAGTGGTVSVSASAVAAGSSVTFTATPKTGFSFDGWYSDSGYANFVSSNNPLITTVSGTAGSTVKYYAKFDLEKVYLSRGVWDTGSPWYAAYFFDGTSDAKWVKMEVDSATGKYAAQIPDGGYKSVIFCRMDNASTSLEWSSVWNQTADLTIPTNTNILYTISGWTNGTNGKSGGSWGAIS